MMVALEKDIGFVAVGGAGLRVAARVAQECSDAVSITLVDTDARALASAPIGVKVHAGAKRTGGHGSGGDVGVGRLSVEDELESLRECVRGQRLLVVFAGLGGGTGSGAAATVLRAGREAGCFCVSVVTLPFTFEGAGRHEKARDALQAIQGTADATLAVPSDRLFAHIGDRDVATTFSMADAILGECIAAVCNLFARPGYIQVDLGDLRSLAQHSEGAFALGYGAGRGEDRVQQILGELNEGPLLAEGALLDGAAGVMVGILGGDDLRMSEVSAIMGSIQSRIPEECRVVMGTTIDPAAGNGLTVVVLCADTWNEQVSPPPMSPFAAPDPAKRGSRNRGKNSQLQPLLGLDMTGKDRFQGVEATIIDGEDLDIPTYVRRGVRLEK